MYAVCQSVEETNETIFDGSSTYSGLVTQTSVERWSEC